MDDWLRKTTRPVRIARVDATAPNLARVWNYMVGGRDNFEADRVAARELVAAAPVMADVAQASRSFLRRVVRFLAAEAGIRQFLDIGTGIPTAGGTHELAQEVSPASRIVYVDNDPVVITHARALVQSRPEGIVSCLEADAREPAANLAIMQPAAHEGLLPVQSRWNQLAALPVWLRDREEVASWFAGLPLVAPGIVEIHQWRPDQDDPSYPRGMPLYGAVGRKS